ncbi:unnamed protein product [Caenorhabditis sp. 36 PRJEB53466]|nr:unnamed protein product [Caenorhabditis sp. 36 PRJEB53466]
MRVYPTKMMRTLWNLLEPESIVENATAANASLAAILLTILCIDTFIGWRQTLFLATSVDDQMSTVVYFFAMVAYFMGCAILGTCMCESPRSLKSTRVYITIIHYICVVIYFFYWDSLSLDDWNPVIYYMPMFYQYTYLLFPFLLYFHVVHTGACTYHLCKEKVLQAEVLF